MKYQNLSIFPCDTLHLNSFIIKDIKMKGVHTK